MNAEQLEALIIDQSLGELPDDVSALLDAYLAQHPDQAAVAPRIRNALAATEAAVTERPGLFRVSHDETNAPDRGARPPVLLSLFASSAMKWAAALAALALGTGAGFFVGRQGGAPSAAIVVDPEHEARDSSPPDASPWARYQVRENGQLAVVPSFQPRP